MKSLLLLVGLLVFSNLSQANLRLAPPNISIGRTKAIFIDIKTIKSSIVYDLGKSKAVAKSEIEFSQGLSGYPIFDLLPTPIKVTINGEVTQTQTTSMDGVSTVRYVKKSLSSGLHKMTIENEISKNISWNSNYLKNAFWMSDLSDRRYIEQYLPTNLEFDQYKKTLSIKIIGTDREHNLVTNGDVKSLGLNEWLVDYPEVYTASSFFYHLTLKGQIPTVYSTYRSIDNREIPITVYTSQGTSKFMNKTKKVLAELERDYGPWPHSQVIVYGAGMGGMEHCGATITSFSALGHELIHSYFARGVMPAHGNAGWVDEAVASWRDSNYPSYTERRLSPTRMAGHSVYERTTDRNAYTKGMMFIGHLNKKFENKESFKLFLRSFFEERKFKPFKTPEFQAAIEKFYGEDVGNLFDKYVYGSKGNVDDSEYGHDHQNPYHPRLSEQQLNDLL